MTAKEKIKALQVAIPDLPKRVVRIATWIMVLSGIALSGTLEFDGTSIAWTLNATVETILKWTLFVSTVLAGVDGGTKSKGKEK